MTTLCQLRGFYFLMFHFSYSFLKPGVTDVKHLGSADPHAGTHQNIGQPMFVIQYSQCAYCCGSSVTAYAVQNTALTIFFV